MSANALLPDVERVLSEKGVWGELAAWDLKKRAFLSLLPRVVQAFSSLPCWNSAVVFPREILASSKALWANALLPPQVPNTS